MRTGSCSVPKPARNPMKGTHATPYEAPVRTSGTPGRGGPGVAKMMNVSEVKPGAGTGGDGVKVRSVK